MNFADVDGLSRFRHPAEYPRQHDHVWKLVKGPNRTNSTVYFWHQCQLCGYVKRIGKNRLLAEERNSARQVDSEAMELYYQRFERHWTFHTDYIHSRDWYDKRQESVRRGQGKCEWCDALCYRPHVHHMTYEHFGFESDRDLVAICEHCHATASAHDLKTMYGPYYTGDAMSSIQLDNGSLLYSSRYDPALVAALKVAIPSSERQWDGARKAWRVTAQHAPTLVQLTEQYLGERIQAPVTGVTTPVTETRILDVRYIGATKDRGGDTRSASGWHNGSWSVIFPEVTLRTWFEAPATPDDANTLYQVLAVSQTADAATLKTAYRRMARQWHPDVCREPGATQVFQAIQHAYEVLNDAGKRARYDAGLKLTATLVQSQHLPATVANSYRAPLRCGLIMAEGSETLGRFIVSRILMWEDITDAYGRSLVTSWPAGADMFVEAWQ